MCNLSEPFKQEFKTSVGFLLVNEFNNHLHLTQVRKNLSSSSGVKIFQWPLNKRKLLTFYSKRQTLHSDVADNTAMAGNFARRLLEMREHTFSTSACRCRYLQTLCELENSKKFRQVSFRVIQFRRLLICIHIYILAFINTNLMIQLFTSIERSPVVFHEDLSGFLKIKCKLCVAVFAVT